MQRKNEQTLHQNNYSKYCSVYDNLPHCKYSVAD